MPAEPGKGCALPKRRCHKVYRETQIGESGRAVFAGAGTGVDKSAAEHVRDPAQHFS